MTWPAGAAWRFSLVLALAASACASSAAGTPSVGPPVPSAPERAARAVRVGTEARPGAVIIRDRVVGGLRQAVAFTFDRRGRIWFVQKSVGDVRVFDPRTERHHRFVLIPDVASQGSQGLLGVALHPGFPREPFVYVFATRDLDGRLVDQVLRVRVGSDGRRRIRVIFSTPADPNHGHTGGRLLFGPDGMLYVALGYGSDPAVSQDLSTPRGKILRMTPEGEPAPGNPFGSLVWAYGIRNSFGLVFDPVSGDLWETDNGPECNDELNRIVPGGNHGWGPTAACGSEEAPLDTNRDGPDPVLPRAWFASTIGPTGVAFCDGCGLGRRSEGALFLGTYHTGELWRAILGPNRARVRRLSVRASPGIVLSLEAGPDGRLYHISFQAIYRLEPER